MYTIWYRKHLLNTIGYAIFVNKMCVVTSTTH